MVLVHGSIYSDCYFLLTHSIQQDGRANWHQQSRPIRHECCRILNDFNVFLIIINIKSIIEFVEDSDGAGVGVSIHGISTKTTKETRVNVNESSQQFIEYHSIFFWNWVTFVLVKVKEQKREKVEQIFQGYATEVSKHFLWIIRKNFQTD